MPSNFEDNKIVEENINSEFKNKNWMFFYPNYNEPISIFELEDLSDETLCILFTQQIDLPQKIFKWRGLKNLITKKVIKYYYIL